MKSKTNISAWAAIIFAISAVHVSAQGLFAGLANRQDELKAAETEFAKVFVAYDPGKLIKGEMARKDDGTPDIALGGDGEVMVGVKLDVDPEAYAAWRLSATNTFAKYAAKVLAPDEKIDSDDRGKPTISVDGTKFIFANDFESVIDSAKDVRKLFFYSSSHVTVFLVDIDGTVVAEPDSLREDTFSFDDEIAIYTCDQTLNDKPKPVSVGEVASFIFSGGNLANSPTKYRLWFADWHGVPNLITNRKHPAYGGGSWKEDRHCLKVDSFPHGGPLETLSRYGSPEFGVKGESKKQISFGKLPNDMLNAVQGVRVCVGGPQYRAFLTELKERAEKEAAERKALEED